ncbi:hypothetical protein E2320_000266 [Naja naja]|nr:hypothetical protein E2320_000266 [Naja naja]
MADLLLYINAALLAYFSCASLSWADAVGTKNANPFQLSCLTDLPSVTLQGPWNHLDLLKANSAVVTWDVLEEEVVIGFAISQQKKDVRMLRFIQEVNTTTRSCSLWDLEEDTEYIVHVQSISIQGQSPASEPVHFKTPREAEKLASKNKGKWKDEVTMKEMGDKNQHLRAGEILIIVVVLFMWAGVIALFCRQYDIIKDNEPNNNKEKAKNTSENSTPEHQSGGLLVVRKLELRPYRTSSLIPQTDNHFYYSFPCSLVICQTCEGRGHAGSYAWQEDRNSFPTFKVPHAGYSMTKTHRLNQIRI